MDPVQLTIIFISLVLTILFVILGIQVWQILKEMKFSLQKVNKMLDDGTKVTGAISQSFTGFAGVLSGLKAGLSFFGGLRKKEDKHE